MTTNSTTAEDRLRRVRLETYFIRSRPRMDRNAPITPDSPWHEGEIALQQSVGVAGQMDDIGRRAIRDHLTDRARHFFRRLAFVVAGAVDPGGDAWATILSGEPGFVDAPAPTMLRITATAGRTDPVSLGLKDGDAVGMLGIDLVCRRRNRLNGVVRKSSAEAFDVVVTQSYGNCSRYIHSRDIRFVGEAAAEQGSHESSTLDARSSAMIGKADTLFIASYVDRKDGSRQVDVSHKGGEPGFVKIATDGCLWIPDFAGNLYFNTLGNILVNPRCGLIFVDFDSGDVLQTTGDGELILDGPEVTLFEGAERLLRFTPGRIVFRPDALPLRRSPRAG
jgi:uncharacterized protein